MTLPIFETSWWAGRLAEAVDREQCHQALFRCDPERWEAVRVQHRRVLRRHVGLSDSVLDAGCAWGRLLSLLPDGWQGSYLGVDLSPDFVEIARRARPGYTFAVHDLREPLPVADRMDWAIVVAIRQMVIGNAGADVWAAMEANLRRAARRLLVLEYDIDGEGEIL